MNRKIRNEANVSEIKELEKRLVWMESFIQDVNDVVVKQAAAIRRLETEVDILQEKLHTSAEGIPEFKKPPHY